MGLGENNRIDLEQILEEFFTPACDEDYKPVNISEHPEYAQVGEYPELCQYWVHKRMEKDIENYKDFISNKSAAGKASAAARKAKKGNGSNTSPTEDNTCSTGEQLTNNHKQITNNHKPLTSNDEPLNNNQETVTKKHKTNGKSKPLVELKPDDLTKNIAIRNINPEAWKEFEQHRKDIKKPLSELARVKAMNTIKHLDWEDQARTIDKSIQSRWSGLFPDKSKVVTIEQSQTRAQQQADRIKKHLGWENE